MTFLLFMFVVLQRSNVSSDKRLMGIAGQIAAKLKSFLKKRKKMRVIVHVSVSCRSKPAIIHRNTVAMELNNTYQNHNRKIAGTSPRSYGHGSD
jgi:hypothetical protein